MWSECGQEGLGEVLFAVAPLDLDEGELLHEVGDADYPLQSGHIGCVFLRAVNLHEIT